MALSADKDILSFLRNYLFRSCLLPSSLSWHSQQVFHLNNCAGLFIFFPFSTHFLLCHQFNVIHYQEYSLNRHISACERNANANLENAQGVWKLKGICFMRWKSLHSSSKNVFYSAARHSHNFIFCPLLEDLNIYEPLIAFPLEIKIIEVFLTFPLWNAKQKVPSFRNILAQAVVMNSS